MYSLFWKIFLSFWATILIIELFTAWFTADLSETEIHPILAQHNQQFVASSTDAVSTLTKNGIKGLREWMSQEENLRGIGDIYVFDRQFNEVNNKPVPSSIRVILTDDIDNHSLVDHQQPIKHMLTFKTTTSRGNEYLVVSTFSHPPLLQYLLAPQRVGLSIVISGLICLLLARYFTSPLTNLRRSTQKLTLGEFDTTSLSRMQSRKDEFGALAVDFNAMTVRLGQLLDNQRQLLRDISHELNSPLSRIRVALELARSKYTVKNEEGAEFDRIEREIERLELLIRELLTFVKIEPKNSSVLANLSKVNVRKMLEEIINDAQYLGKNENAPPTINLNCAEDIDVQADAQLLHRAIENIVRNACYYSPRSLAITINCLKDADNVNIFIEDQGPGVPENMLEKIFQPFVRVSPARESDTGGSGIGLAIAKRVVELHRGKISAKNKKDNSGLIVAILLPVNIDLSNQNKKQTAA